MAVLRIGGETAVGLESVNYKCPSCNGALEFSPASQKLECPFCGSSFEPAYVEQLYADAQAKQDAAAEKRAVREAQEAATESAPVSGSEGEQASVAQEGAGAVAPEIDAVTSAAAEKTARTAAVDPIQAFLDRAPWVEAEELGMKVYTCSSCAAALTVDATTAVTECPYCGNQSVLPGTLAGLSKPDLVIPFKKTKQDAIAALNNHYAQLKFLPDAFTEQSHLEHVQGVYVPFWLVSSKVDFDASFEATNTRMFTDGDDQITETDYYDIGRSGQAVFTRVPVDGSTKMPDAHMDAIEPFDYEEIQAFNVGYLPGYLAERYDLSAQDCMGRACGRMDATVPALAQATISGYDSVISTGFSSNAEVTDVSYALLPVWMLHTTWNNENYLFAMNGQTGRLIGDLPIDKGKVAKFAVLRFIPSFIVVFVIAFVMMGMML